MYLVNKLHREFVIPGFFIVRVQSTVHICSKGVVHGSTPYYKLLSNCIWMLIELYYVELVYVLFLMVLVLYLDVNRTLLRRISICSVFNGSYIVLVRKSMILFCVPYFPAYRPRYFWKKKDRKVWMRPIYTTITKYRGKKCLRKMPKFHFYCGKLTQIHAYLGSDWIILSFDDIFIHAGFEFDDII